MTAATVAAVLIGMLVFDIAVPETLGWFVVSFVLGAFSLLLSAC